MSNRAKTEQDQRMYVHSRIKHIVSRKYEALRLQSCDIRRERAEKALEELLIRYPILKKVGVLKRDLHDGDTNNPTVSIHIRIYDLLPARTVSKLKAYKQAEQKALKAQHEALDVKERQAIDQAMLLDAPDLLKLLQSLEDEAT